MNEVKTIATVTSALEIIINDCMHTQNRMSYFPALYKRMTVAVSEGIRTGQFEDGPRMAALDVIFAQRYLTALEAFRKGEECSSSWQFALSGCSDRSLIVLQQLVLGINTHINPDLAIAAAEVAPGDRIHALKADFNRINLLIASLVDDVQRCLEEVWFPMRFLKKIVNKQGVGVLNFSIGVARKTAWANAVVLANLDAAGQASQIKIMDAMVRSVGERIVSPGFWPGFLLRVIRFTEYEDVARTTGLIDTTVLE